MQNNRDEKIYIIKKIYPEKYILKCGDLSGKLTFNIKISTSNWLLGFSIGDFIYGPFYIDYKKVNTVRHVI